MSSESSDQVPNSDPAAFRPENSDVATPVAAKSSCHLRPTCPIWIGLVAGLLAGVIIWVLLHQFDPYDHRRQIFHIPEDIASQMAQATLPGPELAADYDAALADVARAHSIVFLAGFGAVLGGTLGIAHGLSRCSALAGIFCLLTASLGGALMGAVGGLVGHHLYEYLLEREQLDPLTITLIAQGCMLALMAAGVGFGFGLAVEGPLAGSKTAVFGFAGGALAAACFAFAAATLLPDAITEATLPRRINYLRWLWVLIIGGLAGLAIASAFGTTPADASGTENQPE